MKNTTFVRKQASILLVVGFMVMSATAAMATSRTNEFSSSAISVGGSPRPLGETAIYYYVSDPYQAIGLTSGGTYEAAIRLTPEELAPFSGGELIAANFVHNTDYAPHSGNLKVYSAGTATRPGSLIASVPYNATEAAWIRIDLATPITLDVTKDLWVSIEVTHAAGEYPIATDEGPAVRGKGDFVYAGSWQELYTIPLDYNWMIEAIVESDATQLAIGSITGKGMSISAAIQNVGTNPATDVTMSMQVTGGILGRVNKTIPGTAASIANGASYDFVGGGFFGLGKITIVVTARAGNAMEVSKTATGKLFGPFVLGVK